MGSLQPPNRSPRDDLSAHHCIVSHSLSPPSTDSPSSPRLSITISSRQDSSHPSSVPKTLRLPIVIASRHQRKPSFHLPFSHLADGQSTNATYALTSCPQLRPRCNTLIFLQIRKPNVPGLHRRAGLSPAGLFPFFFTIFLPFYSPSPVAYLSLLHQFQHINISCLASLKGRQSWPKFPSFLVCVPGNRSPLSPHLLSVLRAPRGGQSLIFSLW